MPEDKITSRAEIRVEITRVIGDRGYSPDRMSFSNNMELGELSLAQVASVLVRVHALSAEALTTEVIGA